MNKKTIIIIICAVILSFGAGLFISESDILDNISLNHSKTPKTKTVLDKNSKNNIKNKAGNKVKKGSGFNIFKPKVNITKSKTKTMQFETYDNGLFSMKIPKGWRVGVAKSSYSFFTFMVYDPNNLDYKIFFNMKTEGYMKTQQMRNMMLKYYPNSPFAKLPVISPQTTAGFYSIFTQALSLNQNLFPFKIPVIKKFTPVQTIGKSIVGGSIVRATYEDEKGKALEGIFTTTIKEFQMPPAVALTAYHTVFFTAPKNELVEWFPVLNYSLNTVQFSDSFVNNYYKEQGQTVKNAKALQQTLNQTSNIITSGWSERQKTYDILSQKRSDATMGYERVRDIETGEIYKAANGFMDSNRHGRYEKITDDMYNLPVDGYIEKK